MSTESTSYLSASDFELTDGMASIHNTEDRLLQPSRTRQRHTRRTTESDIPNSEMAVVRARLGCTMPATVIGQSSHREART